MVECKLWCIVVEWRGKNLMGVATVSTQEHLTTKLAVSELYMFQFPFECLWCMCEDNTSNNDNSKHDEL